MRPKTCLCCGQIIAPEINLVGQKRIVYEAVRRFPRTADQLRDLVWNDRNGGPSREDTLYQLVYEINQALKPHGVAMRTSNCLKRSQGEPYRLVPL